MKGQMASSRGFMGRLSRLEEPTSGRPECPSWLRGPGCNAALPGSPAAAGQAMDQRTRIGGGASYPVLDMREAADRAEGERGETAAGAWQRVLRSGAAEGHARAGRSRTAGRRTRPACPETPTVLHICFGCGWTVPAAREAGSAMSPRRLCAKSRSCTESLRSAQELSTV